MNVILSHDHTDFDAVASQLGAWKLTPSWVPVLGRYLNRNVRNFLTLHWDALPFRYGEDLPLDSPIERALLVDTQSIPTLKGVNSQSIPEIQVIDHHERRADLPAHWRVELDSTGSCTTLFVERLAEQRQPLTWVEATLLLLGVHEDTGSLVYSATTVRDGRAVAWLMEQGAHLDTVRQFLDHPLTDRQRTLYRRLLESTEFLDLHGFQIVLAHATMDEYVDDVSSLASSIRDLYDPAALLLAVEMSGHVQLVARSTTSDIHVGHLMGTFGGGGHTRAAAAFVEGEPLEQVMARLKAALPRFIRPTVTVSDLMSRGKIRSLTPVTRIKEAFDLMQRWGHEGFPVVDEGGEVVGVLTRRDVDRALQHRLDNAPVTEFMHKGAIVVTPQDAITRVQRVMTEANIGQVPVVAPETNEILGIITRTDLLKRVGALPPAQRTRNLMTRVETALSPSSLELVREIAREAHVQGHQAYLVGGIVRDLLLKSAVKDLDIVIEGNAIGVARRLARHFGGRVVAHERFGTAKWILRDPIFGARETLIEAPDLPAHIDLITARTEFYERPTALPQIEHASIKQDLHRRDFTINTLALSLDPDHEGQLLDFYGGEADLERGIIRVLHNLSFVEDPTRILRAIRFEQRFAFRLEPRTMELLRASLDLLEVVSPDRLRHELFLIFQEQQAARALARLDEVGVLPLLLPGVRWDPSDAARVERLRAAGREEPEEFLTALVWDLEADPSRIERIAVRLSLSNEWRDRLRTMYAVRREQAELVAPHLRNSELYQKLVPRDARALELLAILTEGEPFRERLRFYLDDLRHRTLAIGGEALRASGLPPGPTYKRLLNDLHAAMLDGVAPDEASQRALLNEKLRPPPTGR